jgi:putative PIN family toxin of toxin-antitoxin system
MMRVVLDTNVIVSAIRAERGPLAIIREGWLRGRFHVVVSDPLLAEVERTLTKPYFAARLGSARIQRFLNALKETAMFQPITEPVAGVATHPEDDWILATA